MRSAFPTLKRGANKLCASGALIRTFIRRPSIKQPQILRLASVAQDDRPVGVVERDEQLLRVIDLGALELVGVVDADGFPDSGEVECAQA